MKTFLPHNASEGEKIVASVNDTANEVGERLLRLGLILEQSSYSIKRSVESLNKTLDQSSQKIEGSVDSLGNIVEKMGKSSDKLSSKLLWLNVVLTAATIVGSIATLISV